MTIDEVTLRAYIDGELAPEERDRVEAALANQPALKAQADALRASCLPYSAAFDAQIIPPIPIALQAQLNNLSAAAQTPSPITHLRTQRRNLLGLAAGLAGAFGAGIVARTMWQTKSEDEPWVQAIASYQALYVRETVELGKDGAEKAAQVLRNFQNLSEGHTRLGQPFTSRLVVPNLNSVGLEFKRIQLLGFGERPLVQMAYLASQGRPAALCVLPMSTVKKADIRAQRIEGLSIVTWQSDRMYYVLALDTPLDKAFKVGQQISESRFPPLYAG
jgi:anti-sigma factor RsiW